MTAILVLLGLWAAAIFFRSGKPLWNLFLSAAGGGAVQPDAAPGGIKGGQALSQQTADDTGKHIAAAADCHAGVACWIYKHSLSVSYNAFMSLQQNKRIQFGCRIHCRLFAFCRCISP